MQIDASGAFDNGIISFFMVAEVLFTRVTPLKQLVEVTEEGDALEE